MPNHENKELLPQVRNDQELRTLYQERNAKSSFRTPSASHSIRRGWYLQLFLTLTIAASVSLLTALSLLNTIPFVPVLPFERSLRPGVVAVEISDDLQHRLAPAVVSFLPLRSGAGTATQPYLAQESVGQGLALSSDGWLVTTQAVLGSTSRSYQVASGSGHLYSSELIVTDPVAPVTFVKTSATGLSATPFADPNGLSVGQPVVVAVLSTQSPEPVFYLRHLSHLTARLVRSQAEVGVSSETIPDRLLLDAPLPPGSQGAPVATLRGEVVGLLSDYGGELRSVVPLDSLGSVIDRLFAERQVHRATLGISYVQSTWLSTFVTSGVPDDGALITALKAPAKAGQAGLMVGDRVVKAAGELVAERSLSSLLQQYRPGARIDLTVERAGKEVRVDVTLGEQVSKPTPSTKP